MSKGKLYFSDPESFPFKSCLSCLCAMCFKKPYGCHLCPLCYPLDGKACVKFCREFIPNSLEDWQLREWFDQDCVIKKPSDLTAAENLSFK